MDLTRIYAGARERLCALAAEITPQEAAAPVPALPEWTVRDTFAHLAGVCADALADRLDPKASPEWTAGHLAQRAEWSLADIRAQWLGQAGEFDAWLTANPQLPFGRIAVDAWHHEQDIRAALGRPGGRQDAPEVLDINARTLQRAYGGHSPAARLLAADTAGKWDIGDGRPATEVRGDAYELARMLLGRRSRAQMLAMAWSGDPEVVLGRFVVFTPPAADLLD